MSNKVGIIVEGKDNVSGTIKKVKEELEGVKTAGDKLKNVKNRMEQITHSGKTLRSQLRNLKDLMVEMEQQGLTNTKVYNELNQRASSLYDNISDATNSIKLMSSDTRGLDTLTNSVQLVTAGFAGLTSAIHIFGVNNKNVDKMIQMTVDSMNLMNSVQRISQLLNRSSIIRLQLKAFWQNLNNKLKEESTLATTVESGAVVANTAVVEVNTTTQKSLNLAKMVGLIISGQWHKLLFVGAGILAMYGLSTVMANKEQEKLNTTTKKTTNSQKNYNDTMKSTFTNLLKSFMELKMAWQSLKSVQEKNKFLIDNREKFNDLGLSIKSVTDAENVFKNNTEAVKKAFMERAFAAAAASKLQDEYGKYFELLNKKEEMLTNGSMYKKTGIKLKEGDEYTYKGSDALYSDYSKMDEKTGKMIVTKLGAWKWNHGKTVDRKPWEKNQSDIKESEQNINDLTENFVSIYGKVFGKLPQDAIKKTTPSSKEKSASNTVKEAVQKGSLKYYQNILSDLQKRYESGNLKNGETKKTLRDKIRFAKNEYEYQKILQTTDDTDEEKYQQSRTKKINEINRQFKPIKLFNPNEGKSSFDIAMQKFNNRPIIDSIKEEMNYNDKLIEQKRELKKQYENLGDVEHAKALSDQITLLTGKNRDLAQSAETYRQNQIDFEDLQNKIYSTVDASNSLSNAFASVGQAFRESGNDAVSGMMQITSIVIQSLSTIIPLILKLIGVKQGESMANGVAEASKLKFPLSLGAIATIVATIASTFGQIRSITSKGFASGGIIEGSSTAGDKLYLPTFNAGEMVLNSGQQAKLFSILNGKEKLSNNTSGKVEFEIKGEDLVGILNTQNKINALTF